ncbi:hypothetical protein K7X08_024048 [Anisodus acutangulus]|uniref:Uncharacterized protein n=1 Tax=Anisodus acutangulus TaxID=402998 RepID=A0A9Q1REL9_9SOLA|nr:hypothetical protein K7X08_024048 [Anisodus acutangulus]
MKQKIGKRKIHNPPSCWKSTYSVIHFFNLFPKGAEEGFGLRKHLLAVYFVILNPSVILKKLLYWLNSCT